MNHVDIEVPLARSERPTGSYRRYPHLCSRCGAKRNLVLDKQAERYTPWMLDGKREPQCPKKEATHE
jgi:hypothetical protein